MASGNRRLEQALGVRRIPDEPATTARYHRAVGFALEWMSTRTKRIIEVRWNACVLPSELLRPGDEGEVVYTLAKPTIPAVRFPNESAPDRNDAVGWVRFALVRLGVITDYQTVEDVAVEALHRSSPVDTPEARATAKEIALICVRLERYRRDNA